MSYKRKSPMPVVEGGTGATTIPSYSVLVGSATSAVATVSPGTTGFPLVSQGASTNPGYAFLTVPGGGTGATTLPSYSVLVGSATSAVATVSPGTTGFPLVSQGASTNPGYASLTVAGGGTGQETLTAYSLLAGGTTTTNPVAFVGPSANGLTLVSKGASTLPAFGLAQVAGGGTGLGTLTNNGIMYGKNTSAIGVTSAGNDGEALVANGGASAPSFGTVLIVGGGTGLATMATTYAPLCAGTTATSALQLASTGLSTSGSVLTSTGASSLPTWQAISTVVTTNYTSSGTGTHVLNTNTKVVDIWLFGPGNGGGAGCRGDSGSSGGGSGGTAGSIALISDIPVARLGGGGASVSYRVPVGGVGGVTQTSNNTSGPNATALTNGGVGGSSNTQFGNYYLLNSTTGAGFGGISGTATAPALDAIFYSMGGSLAVPTANGAAGNGGAASGSSAGTVGSAGNTFSYVPWSGSGAGGAGANSSTERTGGGSSRINVSMTSTQLIATQAGGVESGTINGATGTASSTVVSYLCGAGGGAGGGGQSTGLVAGNGGTGGAPGGGGAGGGGSLNGTNSGVGGNGGVGGITVIEYL